MDLLRMTLSTALVLALLGGLLYVLKRMQGKISANSSNHRLQALVSLSLNSRHKVALLEVDGQRVLVGMSPNQLTLLAHLDGQPSEKTVENTMGRGRHET